MTSPSDGGGGSGGRVVACKVCGKDFVAHASREWICSSECRRARRRAREANSELPGLPSPTPKCRICGESMSLSERGGYKRLCSGACRKEARRQGDAQKWASATPEQKQKVLDRNKRRRQENPEWAQEVDRKKWARLKDEAEKDPETKEKLRESARRTYERNRDAILERRRAKLASLSEQELAERIERSRIACLRHRQRVKDDPEVANRYREAQAEQRRRSREGKLSLEFAQLQEDARSRLAGEKSNQARACVVCQKQFVGKHSTAKVCSAECRQARHNQLFARPPKETQCRHCGTTFVRRTAATTCSPECRRALMLARKKQYRTKKEKPNDEDE